MAKTLANIKLDVYSRLAADMATPAYADIHEDNITKWADNLIPLVTTILDPSNFPSLIKYGGSVALTAGSGNVPSDYQKALTVRATFAAGTYSTMLGDTEEFNRWDSSNFILTPTTRRPVSVIVDGTVKVKPTSATYALIDYIKTHPALSGSQDTLFNDIGDFTLVQLITARAFYFLEENQIADGILKEIGFMSIKEKVQGV